MVGRLRTMVAQFIHLARHRESLGGQRMAEVLFLSQSVCRSTRSYQILRDAIMDRTLELQRNDTKSHAN